MYLENPNCTSLFKLLYMRIRPLQWLISIICFHNKPGYFFVSQSVELVITGLYKLQKSCSFFMLASQAKAAFLLVIKQVDPTSLRVLVSDFSLVLHSDWSVLTENLQLGQNRARKTY